MSFTLTGTNPPNPMFPLGGGDDNPFDIEGTGFNLNPAPIISLYDQTSYQKYPLGFDASKSSDTNIHVTHIPSSPTGEAGTMSIWVQNFSDGVGIWQGLKDAITYQVEPATWQSLGPPTGKVGDIIHINGQRFNTADHYTVKFNDTVAAVVYGDGHAPPVSSVGIWVQVPEGSGTVAVTVTDDDDPNNQVKFDGTDGLNQFTYTS
jgi:hypothetical protein